MGDFADDMIDRMIDRHIRVGGDMPIPRRSRVEFKPILTDEELGDLVWTMADGTRIKVREMGQRHRRNARALLVRRHGEKDVARSDMGRALTVWANR